MPSAFHRAARLLAREEIRAIESVLSHWQKDGIGRIVAPNLRDREHFLPRKHMAALLRAVLGAKDAPTSELAEQYKLECYRHQLRGGRIRLSPQPELLGRAVDTGLFTNYLFKRYRKRFPKLSHAEDFVTRLKAGAEMDEDEEEILMSPYTAWVTWQEDNPTGDPFGFVRHGLAVEVKAALGLDQRLTGPLLLLRYKRPANVRLHRPTVADAGLFPYFDPPMLTEKAHSRTRPWPPFSVSAVPPLEICADPQPEAVHRPVKMKAISQPIDEVP